MKLKHVLTGLTLAALIAGGTASAEDAPLPPPSADTAQQALETSTRHGEFEQVPLGDSDLRMRAFVAYPERAEKAPVVIVIHEIFGLTEWIQSVADALAREGFIAIAPDLITGIEGAAENPREAIGKLSDEEAVRRLDATHAYATALPAADGTVAVMGFCWGGRMSFHYATQQPKLACAIVYYGTSAQTESLASIQAPVLGLYGEDDARVNATIPAAEEEMKRLEKRFEKEIYAGAGHGFLRQQDGRDGANARATEQAWARTVNYLREHTGK